MNASKVTMPSAEPQVFKCNLPGCDFTAKTKPALAQHKRSKRHSEKLPTKNSAYLDFCLKFLEGGKLSGCPDAATGIIFSILLWTNKPFCIRAADFYFLLCFHQVYQLYIHLLASTGVCPLLHISVENYMPSKRLSENTPFTIHLVQGRHPTIIPKSKRETVTSTTTMSTTTREMDTTRVTWKQMKIDFCKSFVFTGDCSAGDTCHMSHFTVEKILQKVVTYMNKRIALKAQPQSNKRKQGKKSSRGRWKKWVSYTGVTSDKRSCYYVLYMDIEYRYIFNCK